MGMFLDSGNIGNHDMQAGVLHYPSFNSGNCIHDDVYFLQSILRHIHPLREKIFRKPKILSATIWILSLVMMVPYPMLYQIEYNPQENKHFCLQVWPWQDKNDVTNAEIYRVLKIFHITIFVVLYAWPLTITIVFYFLIYRKLWLRKIPGNVTTTNRISVINCNRIGLCYLLVPKLC